MRLLVCGNRDWSDVVTIDAWLKAIFFATARKGDQEFVVIHGAASGADIIAGEIAKRRDGLTELAFPADWNPGGVFDPDAGKKRNQAMLDEGRPTRVLAFGQLMRPSRRRAGAFEKTGTCDMIERANDAGLIVTIVPRPGIMP
jgi:hypothetical protein